MKAAKPPQGVTLIEPASIGADKNISFADHKIFAKTNQLPELSLTYLASGISDAQANYIFHRFIANVRNKLHALRNDPEQCVIRFNNYLLSATHNTHGLWQLMQVGEGIFHLRRAEGETTDANLIREAISYGCSSGMPVHLLYRPLSEPGSPGYTKPYRVNVHRLTQDGFVGLSGLGYRRFNYTRIVSLALEGTKTHAVGPLFELRLTITNDHRLKAEPVETSFDSSGRLSYNFIRNLRRSANSRVSQLRVTKSQRPEPEQYTP